MSEKPTGSRARKRKKGTPTHVASWPLRTTPADRRTSEIRFEAGRRLYNAVLGECLRRLDAMRADPAFDAARNLPKGDKGSARSALRSRAFAAVAESHSFGVSALMSFASSLRQSHVRDHVLAQEAQELGRRAFGSTQRFSLDLGGRPRFKRASDGLTSLSCKDTCGSMRPVLESGVLVGFQWGRGMVVDVASASAPAEHAELARISALLDSGQLLYCRLVCAVIRQKTTYRAQFVLDGPAPRRHRIGTDRVGVDLGPSAAHVVPQHSQSFHADLRVGLEQISAQLRRHQRHLDRQHRAGSPVCFDETGCHVHGTCHWRSRSKGAQHTQSKIHDAHRRLAETRKAHQGQLIN